MRKFKSKKRVVVCLFCEGKMKRLSKSQFACTRCNIKVTVEKYNLLDELYKKFKE